jgi:tRNA(fMet)-specific endonuclease VapC
MIYLLDANAMTGDSWAVLEGQGTPIGPYDLLIAAQSLRTGATLVTANVAEFRRIKGLSWQDWAAGRT